MPVRIQRKRTKGWKMPEGAVYVGRPTKWGNPFNAPPLQRKDAVRFYSAFVSESHNMIRAELAGKDLACYCPLDVPCHADVLLEIANSPVSGA